MLLVDPSLCISRSIVEEPDSNRIWLNDSTLEVPELIDSSSNFVVTIDRKMINTGRILDTLDIYLEAGNNSMAGFDLRIAVENKFIEILNVLPGEILDSCSWEFFNAKMVEPAGRENYPRSVWHIVALAEFISDETRPACFGFKRRASLIRLIVSSEHVEFVPDTTAAVYFYWERCSDNSISGTRGDTLSMSDQLHDYYPVRDFETEGIFPTRHGMPNQCIDPSARNRPIRRIDFHNGGVEFELRLLPKTQPDSVDGDLFDSL